MYHKIPITSPELIVVETEVCPSKIVPLIFAGDFASENGGICA